ncbi:uncharacterized protein TNCV_135251 [Trichonephila clavipes]|nr:uncharacterized protein TNCV_135251 [Trichonephila clavipes]
MKSLSKNGLVTISWQEESEGSSPNNLYESFKNCSNESYCIKDEDAEKDPLGCAYVHSLPEIYDYSSDSTWNPQTDISSQVHLGEGMNVCKCIVPLRHAGWLFSHRTASPHVRLVEGPSPASGFSTSKLGWNRSKSFCHLHGAQS